MLDGICNSGIIVVVGILLYSKKEWSVIVLSNYDNKKDVKLQVYITSKMDDELQSMAEVMCVSKLDAVRYLISQGIMGYKTSIGLVRDNADKIIDNAISKKQ